MTVLFAAIDVATWENDRYTYAFQIALIALIAYPASLLLSRIQSERLIEHQWALWVIDASFSTTSDRLSHARAAYERLDHVARRSSRAIAVSCDPAIASATYP
ncbi:hypothetical protein [Mycobacteroides chelonae]